MNSFFISCSSSTYFSTLLQVERSAWIACKQKEKQLALPGANKDKFEAEIEQLMDMSGAVPMYLNQFCDAFVKAKPGEFRMQQAMSTYAAESLAPVVDGTHGISMATCTKCI